MPHTFKPMVVVLREQRAVIRAQTPVYARVCDEIGDPFAFPKSSTDLPLDVAVWLRQLQKEQTMTTTFRDPLDPQDRPCPAADNAENHHLVITGPMHHRILRCNFCGMSERAIRAQIAREEEE